jgi:hypothetical protein
MQFRARKRFPPERVLRPRGAERLRMPGVRTAVAIPSEDGLPAWYAHGVRARDGEPAADGDIPPGFRSAPPRLERSAKSATRGATTSRWGRSDRTSSTCCRTTPTNSAS